MLTIGRQRQRTCQGVTRRALLEAGACAALGLAWPDLLRARGEGAAPPARARAVILLWLWGGPAHLDTWDMKPGIPVEYRGPFMPIPTKVPGLRVCELFPRLAGLADRFAVLRSLHTKSNDHGVAGTIGLTGSAAGAVNLGGAAQGGSVRPALGAVVAKARGGGRDGLPPFLVVGG
jgi:hypothetical protein